MNKDLYIVDNSSENKSVLQYLNEWCDVSKQFDIATGYLDIGGFLALDGQWQKLEKIRIILGNEMTRRTKDVIDHVVDVLLNKLDDSINIEHEKNEFLVGVPAILNAMKTGKIECRVYDKSKFHAKAYITTFKDEYKNNFISAMNIPNGYALVGSSNFTKAGLTQNIELNVQVEKDVDQLQDWFNTHWENGEDITEAILKVIENHCKEYSPYDVYLRSMYELFQGRESTISEWEMNESIVYKMLSQYQRDGYNSLVEIADRYSGAFLCDGVGLGKTFVGLMLIERFVKKERKNVVLIVPASARISVWENKIKKYMPEILEGFFPFKIINHTDLLLEKNDYLMKQIMQHSEIVIIDEAHHFRNRSSNRYKKLFEIIGNGSKKKVFMLTATPINNTFLDLQHLIELFTSRVDDFFSDAPLGIHSLQGHFKKMEMSLKSQTSLEVMDASEVSDNIFRADPLVNALVVQRSRAYVKKSLSNSEGDKVLFSVRQAPIVANYSLKKSYGRLIDDFVNSFYRKDKETGRSLPILALAVYSPYEPEYFIGDKSKLDDMVTGRQKQVVNLIRQLLLKRFESSIAAFEETCIRIYYRLYKFVNDYKGEGNKRIDRVLLHQSHIIQYVEKFILSNMEKTIDEMDDELPNYVWDVDDNELSKDDFNIEAMLEDTILDMEVLAKFIEDTMNFDSSNDDKIRELKHILLNDKRIVGKKVIIFSEFRSTARYIYNELLKAGFKNVFEIDGQSNVNREDMIVRFAPYYNESSSKEVENEIQILIATDVLAEGLNLQDAQCLINYELHWNPVRLMQRIGRVDRRRDIEIESKLLLDHPELKEDRENAYYWNFLPPTELEQLLSLYGTVSKKTLRISKTFGIEGKKLLTPDDDYDALKEFNSQYEGEASSDEEMELEYQQLLKDNPTYLDDVKTLPKKMWSGKLNSSKKGVFFCYELPLKKADGSWSSGDGLFRWYFIDSNSNEVIENTYTIWNLIKCSKEEQRNISINEAEFTIIKKQMEKYLKKKYMKQAQVPLGMKPRLVTWIEVK